MNSLRYLKDVGDRVQTEFLRRRSILSFQEYLDAFLERPRAQARSAAQYLRDCLDYYGTETVQRPSGPQRRFKMFDRPWESGSIAGAEGESGTPVFGQEEAQNAIYRILNTFVRRGRINKLILLHGPNGSAKSSIVAALFAGLEHYSRLDEGALYRFNWVFPSEKIIKGSIGFGEEKTSGHLTSFAHLDGEQLDARIACEMKCQPLWLLPRAERLALFAETVKPDESFHLAQALAEGDLCHRCRQIYAALLQTAGGDVLKVLRHVQVERFFLSRRYLTGAVIVEPQMSVDADYRQVTQDRSPGALPPALQNLTLFEPFGPLVSGNRGMVEFSDLLKRPLESYKYLLGTVETGVARLAHFLMQLDCILIASANEQHLDAFKEIPDWPSFKGRIELVRVPYLREVREEQKVYDHQFVAGMNKHVAPHATEVAALWAVLTRLKRPTVEHYRGDARALVEKLAPLEKLQLYDNGRVPDRLNSNQAKELRRTLAELWSESDAYPNYEGLGGASAREIKTVLDNAAQSPAANCLTAQAVLEELAQLVKDKSVYEFLQQPVVDGYHDAEAFLRVVEGVLLDRIDDEVREAMGLVSASQYRELFERYVQHVVAWTRGEKLFNQVTGDSERPDEEMMAATEAIIMVKSEDRREFRRALISSIGAQKIDHPDEALDYAQIFPDLFRRLREHFFEERKRTVRRNSENVLRHLGGDGAQLLPKELEAVKQALAAMQERSGYCVNCAKEALVLLLSKRYAS